MIVVLLALFLAVVAFVIWQNDTLRAVLRVTQNSKEELEQRLEENREHIQAELRGHPELSVRDLTEEEKEALREGFLSEEQLVERLTMTSKTADPYDIWRKRSGWRATVTPR